MFDFELYHGANISDFERSNWTKFDQSMKLRKLGDYRVFLRPLSVNYRRCLREYLYNHNQTLDTELIDSMPQGMFTTAEVCDYLKKSFFHASASDRRKVLSHKLISNELKEELKKIVTDHFTPFNPLTALDKVTDCTVGNSAVEVNDSDFEIDNWKKLDCQEQRSKLILQGSKVQLMMNNYKHCLFEYLSNNTSCHELIGSLPDNMMSLPEFKDKLVNLINHASDNERILLLYIIVDLKYDPILFV